MVREEKAIEIINKYLQCAHETSIRRCFPVVASQIYGNGQLCEHIIDYLGELCRKCMRIRNTRGN